MGSAFGAKRVSVGSIQYTMGVWDTAGAGMEEDKSRSNGLLFADCVGECPCAMFSHGCLFFIVAFILVWQRFCSMAAFKDHVLCCSFSSVVRNVGRGIISVLERVVIGLAWNGC